jgi:ribosome-binding ATPase YchF (GTP1/OBG family)
LAETDIRPFTTIDPHEAVVPVPDKLLQKLSILVKPDKTVPASVTFIDIAGLVKDAHKGEGLGNQFLGKIREVDAVIHVLRKFKEESVVHVHDKIDPIEDLEIVNLELELGGISGKPSICVMNVDEDDLAEHSKPRSVNDVPCVSICAKLEEELVDLDEGERREYLEQLGVSKSGLEILVRKSYKLLDLITFYTIKGGIEVHAWSIKKGSSAIDAAEIVHTDFAKNFIKAEVVNVEELLNIGGWKEAKEKGKVRLEGKDYIVQDMDVVEFVVGKV